MRWGGVIILAFVVYHLLHFTVGSVHPDFVEGDVYHNVVVGFRAWPVAAFYVISMLLLGLHLRHGIWSMFQSLGVSHPRYLALAQVAAAVISTIVVIGNVSFPLSVLFGLVGR
jgi:succinate dehydrogenase / fumarate reductase cytochrome b subunit